MNDELPDLFYFSENNYILKYEAPNSACFDIPSAEDFKLVFGVITKIKTGLYVEVPIGYVLEIYPRSGLASKYGMILINTPAQIDCGYHDEIIIMATSLARSTTITPANIKAGERIVQGRLVKLSQTNLHPFSEFDTWKDNISTPNRGGGLGSTGTK